MIHYHIEIRKKFNWTINNNEFQMKTLFFVTARYMVQASL